MNKVSELKKRPKSVLVYNKLLQMILDGTYKEGDSLPGEMQLSELLGVSRMTLRQAINILCEDGLIERRKGIGNFVKKTVGKTDVGIEKIENPIYKCCNNSIKQTSITFGVISSKEYNTYFNYIFDKESPVVFSIERIFADEEDNKVISNSIISINCIEKYEIDIESSQSVEDFVQNKMYEDVRRCSYKISYIPEEDFGKERRISSKYKILVLLTETIYDNVGEILAFSKYYYPLELFNLLVSIYNR